MNLHQEDASASWEDAPDGVLQELIKLLESWQHHWNEGIVFSETLVLKYLNAKDLLG